MTDENPPVTRDDEVVDIEEYDLDEVGEVDETEEGAPVQYGVWPFSIREIVLLGIWALAFVVSFFSLSYFAHISVWTMGLAWLLTIGLPTVAVFLLVLRRLSPQGIRRVGSLGIDQFASVAFSVSALVWVQMTWDALAWPRGLGSWVHWVELVLMAGGVVFTVIAPHIPGLREDFEYRGEVPAHRVARGTRPVAQRPAPVPVPAPEQPAFAETGAVYPVAGGVYDAAPSAGAAEPAYAATGEVYTDAHAQTTAFDETFSPVEEQAVAEEPVATQAFWVLVPEEREILDDAGIPLFRIDPTAWALVIEDRGAVFVVRHEDGRIGYLHDVSGVTRG